MPFYQEMADMVNDLLLPDTEGGLGQVTIELTRTSMLVDPERDWEAGTAFTTTERLRAAAGGAEEYADGDTVLKTDIRVVSGVPLMDWRPPRAGDSARLSLTLDGRPVTIVRIRGIPPVGTPAAVEFIARG